jgi:glucoamylase
MIETAEPQTTTIQTEIKTIVDRFAPGWPGIPARWTSSAKTGIGTALSDKSHVWFTLSHGILNEVYYPRLDNAAIRDMGLIVTDGADLFSEEKRDTIPTVQWLAEGAPAYRLINTCKNGLYRIEKEIIADPQRDTILQKISFVPLGGTLDSYQLHVLLAPHLGNQGGGNTAWVGTFDEVPLLFAQQGENTLALACSASWLKRSAGFAGTSDGWLELKTYKEMIQEYTRAENGNTALLGRIDLVGSGGNFVLALGFGKDTESAARNAIASIREDFDTAKKDYIAGWHGWIKSHASLRNGLFRPDHLSQISLAVLRTHESKSSPGAFIASLALPWGFSKGDKDQGGYHLVWTRDMVETAGGLLAAHAHGDTRRALDYLRSTQQPDGHWAQNMWIDGTPYWNGLQMDETALPILLLNLAYREKALDLEAMHKFWPMMRAAAAYVARNGPVSAQDRWEEDPGYSSFTLGAEIASLLAAADMAELNNEKSTAIYLREVADTWNGCIEQWTYVSDTDWSRRHEVAGYYVRTAPVKKGESSSLLMNPVHVKNVSSDESTRMAIHLISPDALALVRFGLRAADDPRIRDTIKIIDDLLKIETPGGPTWHRYNDDGYGEHADGAPFDGKGIGRGWPLLTGERGHYELMAGRAEKAKELKGAMQYFSNEGGLISEQVWDEADIPARELYFGRPSGSAMPLVWAHAEYLKLQRSLLDGQVFDLPPQTVDRYIKKDTKSVLALWRFNHKIHKMESGKVLRIESLAEAIIHWSDDDWKTTSDTKTVDTTLGIYYADLPTQGLTKGGSVQFTFYWPEAGCWEDVNFIVRVS